jgi:hypothetical protein
MVSECNDLMCQHVVNLECFGECLSLTGADVLGDMVVPCLNMLVTHGIQSSCVGVCQWENSEQSQAGTHSTLATLCVS